MKNWERNYLRGQFADWLYVRTGIKATEKSAEVLRKAFMAGALIQVNREDWTKGKVK